jgi:integrase
MSEHLKDSTVKRLAVPATGNRIVYDETVSGFGIRVTAGDVRAFVLNYRTKGGRERRITIGGFPNWTTAAARDRAKLLKRQIDEGGDPLGDIQEERAAPTMVDLCKRFEAEHLPKRRERTAADYRRILNKHVVPHFGLEKVADVTLDHVDALHRKISKAGHLRRANTVVAVLSKMFNLAERWNMRPLNSNPCRHIEKHAETKRKRYLKPDELERLLEALRGHPHQQAANVVRVLLMSGARSGETLAMRWADLELTAGKWVKPASTTKQNSEHEVPLSAPLRQLLGEMHDQQSAKGMLCEWVFPGYSNGDTGHLNTIKKSWAAICKAAGITGLRIHDLRHSFASQLVSGGASLPLIGALLGHAQASTTHRYAHLFDDPQRAAVEKVGAAIVAAGQPAAKDNRIPFKPRSKRKV